MCKHMLRSQTYRLPTENPQIALLQVSYPTKAIEVSKNIFLAARRN